MQTTWRGALATLALTLGGAAATAPTPAAAQAPAAAQTPAAAQPRPGRDVQLTMLGSGWVDVGYVALAGGALAFGSLGLNPPTVNIAPLDGLGARTANATWDTTSTVVLAGGMAASVGVAFAIEHYRSGSRGWDVLRAPLLLAESALMASGVVNLLKNLVGECRPRAWDAATLTCVGTDPGHLVREDLVAFPSGHTAPLAAMAGASLGLVLLPSRARPEYLPLFVLTGALAAANLVLRELAGAHTWVDTSAGFVLGGVVGFGTAVLHTRVRSPVTLSVANGGLGLQLGGAF